VTTALYVAHGLLGAIWLGAMAYSLTVVQPKVGRYFAAYDDGQEAFLALIASATGGRSSGLVVTLAGTGLALWWATGWHDVAVHVVKAIALLGAAAIVWYVSWRHWPRRVFAVGSERPTLRRQLRLLAATITGLVGVAFVLGLALVG